MNGIFKSLKRAAEEVKQNEGFVEGDRKSVV